MEKALKDAAARTCRELMRRHAIWWRTLRAAGANRRANINLREAIRHRDRAKHYEAADQ